MWHVRFQFPDQGWNPYSRHGKNRVPTTGTPGKSPDISFISCPSWAFPEVQELIRSDFTQFKKKKKKDFARSPGGGAVLKRVRSSQDGRVGKVAALRELEGETYPSTRDR